MDSGGFWETILSNMMKDISRDSIVPELSKMVIIDVFIGNSYCSKPNAY
jgi:hypothetical protein